MNKTLYCCGQIAGFFEDVKVGSGETMKYGYSCSLCGNVSASNNLAEAEERFLENAKPEPIRTPPKQENKIAPINNGPKQENKPKMNNQSNALAVNRTSVMNLFKDENHLKSIVSPIINQTDGAMERLIQNNLRYVENLSGKGYDKLWQTEQGKAALIRETEEAFIMGLEMGKLGDILPFGDDCKWVPTVEGVDFTLTNGNNAPFKWIQIDVEYEGDTVVAGRKTGSFFVDFESFGEERTVVRKVHVYGLSNKTGLIEGETYDAVRLLAKAYEHSDPYKNYMKKINAFEFAKSEGRVEKDANGREFFKFYVIKDQANDKYFQKSVDNFYAQEAAGTLKRDSKGEYSVEVIPKGKNGPWEKKFYRYELEGSMQEEIIYPDDLTNPYAGPDQPEMLRKTAGKSWAGKYLKVRNSEAAMKEAQSHEDVRDAALSGFDNDTVDGVGEEV